MRGANVVRKRSVTNPGDPASAAGAVPGGPADGEGSVPLAAGSAAGDGSDAASGGQAPAGAAQPQAGPPLPAGTVGSTPPHQRRPGAQPGVWYISGRRASAADPGYRPSGSGAGMSDKRQLISPL